MELTIVLEAIIVVVRTDELFAELTVVLELNAHGLQILLEELAVVFEEIGPKSNGTRVVVLRVGARVVEV